MELTNTSLSATDRIKRRVLRAIEANPGASDRKIAQIANCDHKTVAAHRRGNAGELPAISGESPTPDTSGIPSAAEAGFGSEVHIAKPSAEN